tara:strand:+ start:71 stop:1339 length:1269 start_codon:yes stop_codon:yes gene_type:complete
VLKKITENATLLIATILGLIFLYIKFLLSENLLVPETDEVVSINIFTDYRTIFLRYIPNNHFFTSLLGMITNYIFGVNIVILRSLSFVFLLLSIIHIHKNLQNKNIIILILLAYSFDDLSMDYSFLFRGYFFSSFLLVIIFFNLMDLDREIKKIRIILILSSLLIFHSLSNIYIVLPIIFVIGFKLLKNNKLVDLKYFLIPSLLLFSISICLTGIYLNKNIVDINNVNYLLNVKNIYKILYDGFNSIFFPNTGPKTLTGNFNEVFNISYYFLLLFLLVFIKLIYQVIKKNRSIEYVILLFFVCVILINKIPPERLIVSYALFFILYIVYDLKFTSTKKMKIVLFFSFIIVILNFSMHSFFTSSKIHLVKNDILKKIKVSNCELKLSSFKEFEYHYFYYKYLIECKKKPDVFIFYEFYKTRIE